MKLNKELLNNFRGDNMECVICKKNFIPVNGKQKTCSIACRMEKTAKVFSWVLP